MDPGAPGRLPRRDYWILPLLSVLTLALLFGIAELTARYFWPAYTKNPCLFHDGEGLSRYRANCSAPAKLFEGEWLTYHYNGCGYRSRYSCAGDAPGIRIALLGSSFALGEGVAYERTFAGETETALTDACRRTVEIQNVSIEAMQVFDMYRRIDEVLALHPDVVVITINPYDVAHLSVPPPPRKSEGDAAAWKPFIRERNRLPFLIKLEVLLRRSRAIAVAQHFLFQDEPRYLGVYLQYGDDAGFLRWPFSPKWQERFAHVDQMLGKIAQKVHARDVPLVFISGLQRAQVGFLSTAHLAPGIDPSAFERKFQTIAKGHAMRNIDPDPDFSRISHASNLFFAVDGHMAPEGHRVYSGALVRGLLGSGLPVFSGCAVPPR